ncbi:hypothetical protein [Thioalkalivibrio sp. ALR17-21]|uniref:hypothetical protein n=1 Tax=Thioalkalivibrio sp. ALR17-21 TaxID=1269813 RepID=UPI0003F7F342|nr:hypothetical protein [Thioalkalivibrio sp. ALR17-21]
MQFERANKIVGCLLATGLLTAAGAAKSDELRPFVLADSVATKEHGAVVEEVAAKLREGPFEMLGQYAVDDGRHVFVVSHPELTQVANDAARSAYLAPVRVAVTDVGGEVQVAYNNLEYFRHAYEVEEDLVGVREELASVLGNTGGFGSEDAMTASDLRGYRYMVGMERFDDPYELASHDDAETARAAIEATLAQEGNGVSEVYRLDLDRPGVTLYGVAVDASAGAPEEAGDRHKLDTVDVGDRRHTAYLPYEILVNDGEVEALHMRFRMALHWPDLGMLGSNSFFQLRSSPGVLEEVLEEIAAGP